MNTPHPDEDPASREDRPTYGTPGDPAPEPGSASYSSSAHEPPFGASGYSGGPGGPGPGPGSGTGPVPPSGPSTPPGARFFDWIRSLGVVRPDQGRWFAGVCAGLARRWGMSPMVVRALFVVVSLVFGFGLALYGLLWLLLPHPDGRIHAQQVLMGKVTAGFIGSVIMILVGHPFGWASWGHAGGWHHGIGLIPLALIVAGVWWLIRRSRNQHVHHNS